MVRLYEYLYLCVPRLRFLKHVRGQHYLDFGCGDGVALCQNLAVRPDLIYFATDVKDFQKELPPNVVFTVYDGESLPYQDNTFDIITVNHVLEHVHNPNTILSELKRIVKVGGRIFIEVPNERSLWGEPGGRFAGTVHFRDDSEHICPYSKRDLIELCQNFDFKIIKFGISRNLLHLVLSPVLLVLAFLMPKKLYFMYARNSVIGWALYIVLEKLV